MNLPTEMSDRLTKELVPGESVVWSMQLGHRELFRARRGCLLGATALLLVPCLPLLLFGNHMAWYLVGGLLLISIVLICSTTRHYRKTYFQSTYAITNKRAIVLAGPQLADVRQTEAQVWSFYPDVLRNREVVVRKDGTGDIIFWKRWFHTASDVTDSIAIAFNNIPGVSQVDGFMEAVVRQDSGHDKTVSDEDVCRSLHCDYSVMRSDWPKEAGKRKAIVATSLIGVAFLMVVVHQLCCVCNFFGLGSDMGQFDRGIALALALSFSLGAAICLNAVRQWSNEKERRNEQKAQL